MDQDLIVLCTDQTQNKNMMIHDGNTPTWPCMGEGDMAGSRSKSWGRGESISWFRQASQVLGLGIWKGGHINSHHSPTAKLPDMRGALEPDAMALLAASGLWARV